MGQPLRVRQISLAPPQRLFGPFAFSNIDNRAHELHQITGLITDRMTDRVDVSDRTARVNNSVVCFKVRFVANRVFEQFPDSDLVLRTKALEECFESRRPSVRIETKHTISFIRPIPDLASGGRPCPTSGMAEPLRFRHIGFALAAGRFRQITLDSDAREMSTVFNRVLLKRTRAAWLAIIHGKRSDHFAFGGENRRGPTRAERMRQSQIAKISPQWIGRDVGHNYLLGAMCGRST